MTRPQVGALVSGVLLCVIAVLLIGVPAWLVVIGSAKSQAEAATPGLLPPSDWQLSQNYSNVLGQGGVSRGLINTLIVTIPSVVGALLIGAMAGWVFARKVRRSISLVYYACIAAIIFPPALVTTLMVLRFLHVYGTQVGLVFVYLGIFTPFAILLITGFVKTIPIELEDAARLDGANSFTVFTRIILPLLTPVLVTGGFIITVALWNDFFFPLLVLSSGTQNTLTLALYSSVSAGGQHVVRWNLVFANVVLAALPMLVLYAFLRRRVIAGFRSSASNG